MGKGVDLYVKHRDTHCNQPLIKALKLNNKEVAKAYLKHAPDIEQKPWYKDVDEDCKDRIKQLRTEIQNEGHGLEEKADPVKANAEALNRALYNLKRCFFAAFTYASYAVDVGTFAGTPGVVCTSAILWISILWPLFASREDFSKGYNLLLSEGVVETIKKMYDAPRYNPLSHMKYQYQFTGSEDGAVEYMR